MQASDQPTKLLNSAVIVAALGYFVDIFDLQLFGVMRVKSLTTMGYSGQALTDAGLTIQNWQMAGLLFGGIATGIIGDKVGRIQALYGSILIYSVATIATGFATNVEMYALCRFISGIGLAGELGAGITLVAESLPTARRGLGTTIVAAFGVLGAVCAGLAEFVFDNWRYAYYFGGALGIVLFIARLRVAESGVFKRVEANAGIVRGNLLDLFSDADRRMRLLKSTLVGVSTWFVVGILMYHSPEFGVAKGIEVPILAASAVVWFHIGMSLGDVSCGLLSQYLRSRMLAIRTFICLQFVLAIIYLYLPVQQPFMLYVLLFLLGFSNGFWAVFITNAAEQFGTNLRATAACSIPAFVRGLFIPMSMSFKYLKMPAQFGDLVTAATCVGAVCFALAIWATFGLKDTFSKDMDWVEG
jgi:MFS transporter, putative metabolite:H+ symporter